MADGSSVALSTLAYLAFALLTQVGPGIALQRLLGLRVDPALVLPLGFAFCAGASWLALASGHGWLFPVLAAAALLVLPLRRGEWCLAASPRLGGAVAPALAVVALLAAVQYPLNRMDRRGAFLLDDLERIDTAFHVGVTWELATSYPPQVPGLAGFPLGYHLGSHLIRAAALRWAGLHPYDSLYRFDVTLSALALVLALRAGCARLGGGAFAAALAGFSPLLTEFSFVFALVPGARWWTELTGANLLSSLVFANSAVPALALALGTLVALDRRLAGEGRGYLALAALLAFAVPFFKVFLAAQLLLGLGLAAFLGVARRELAALSLPCLAATAALASGPGGRALEVLLDPLASAARTRELLALPELQGAALLTWSLLWLVASLGLRVAGLAGAVRALWGRAAAGVVLAGMALSGWPLALLLRVSADEKFNEVVYFTAQSGALLWLFTATALERLVRAGVSKPAVALACAALALPSTLELAVRKAATPPDVVPRRVLRALQHLAQDTRPGDVVLTRPGSRFPPLPVVFIGRRVPFTLYIPYLRQFAPEAEVRGRGREVRAFFAASEPEEARRIARRLGARHVLLFGPQEAGAGAEAVLDPIYLEREVGVYRIKPE